MAFTHLHVHTEYSLLDGASKIDPLVRRAGELGMESLAITDHGVMYGVVAFYKACKKAGIRPILGCEVYVAARSRFDREVTLDKEQGHLILLAENNEGYRNLCRLVSRSFTEGFYYKPRVDRELLAQYSDGLIALSGCLAGYVQRKLALRDYDGAKDEALAMQRIFGEGNFFLEVQDHGLPEQQAMLPLQLRLHEETGIPLVATNDIHYIYKEDAALQDVLLCIQTNASLDDPERMRFPNDEFYLKSEKEMRTLFASLPEACDNTEKIAARCHVEIDFDTLHIPDFPVPEGQTTKEYLAALCREGLMRKYGRMTPELTERMDYELGVIADMGYIEYFLIVWDYVRFAREHGITVGPGRGSAAGSLVAYCLDITNTDPIENELIFERFLNPGRVSMPDIDIDFADDRRQELIDYVVDKYGEDRVTQIITFNTFGARGTVRDVARVLQIPMDLTDRTAKMIPQAPGMTIDKALLMNPEFRAKYEEDPQVRRLIDTAKGLEGMPRHTSVHAAGVVISREKLEDYVPLHKSDNGIETQFEAPLLEEMGFLKMDFLGLRNLTVIQNTIRMVEKNHGVKIDIDDIPYDDAHVYGMISEGNTAGIFQLESEGMTRFMKRLKPDVFQDIVAGVALFRPGPMQFIDTYVANKRFPEKTRYLHESLRPILAPTYGCIVYQEQVMQIARELAGYTNAEADELRRTMSKKKMEKMKAEKEHFLAGTAARGIAPEIGAQIYDQLVSFAEYAFNKSHSAAYAMISYQTAYLKYYYPTEFMAALLTSVQGNSAQVAKYITNCTDNGISLLPPDVNESGHSFTAVGEKCIRFGLDAVKNVGGNAVEAILERRGQLGSYRDVFAFFDNIDTKNVNKRACEGLIRSGAFDTLEPNRASLLAGYEELFLAAQNDMRSTVSGQISLFSGDNEAALSGAVHKELPKVENFPPKVLGAMEKETLGVYITANPLDDYVDMIRSLTPINTAVLADPEQTLVADKGRATIAGILTGLRTKSTKNNQLMANAVLEDLYGRINVTIFPRTFEQYRPLLEGEPVVAVSGQFEFNDDGEASVIANAITRLEDMPPAAPAGVVPQRIKLLAEESDLARVTAALPGLLKTPSKTPMCDELRLYVRRKDGSVQGVSAGKCAFSQRLLLDLQELVGKDSIKVEDKA